MTAGQRDGETRRKPPSAAVADRAEATRSALIVAARHLFVERGYHDTSTEEIVALAAVGTRGALYHHFADKRALFVAVFEAVEEDLVVAAGSQLVEAPPLEMLRNGLLGFLDASVTPEVQRILLIDGPAVLGWQEWRAVEARYGLGGIQAMLELAVADGSLAAATARSHGPPPARDRRRSSPLHRQRGRFPSGPRPSRRRDRPAAGRTPTHLVAARNQTDSWLPTRPEGFSGADTARTLRSGLGANADCPFCGSAPHSVLSAIPLGYGGRS